MNNNRLSQQIQFLIEVEKLKSVFRRTYILDTSRNENDAEHSWHLAMMALILSEYANNDIKLLHVVKMVLIHDIIEINAGDTFCYDLKGNLEKIEKEKKAAEQIYSILPENQKLVFIEIWDEFENGNTAEAKFARALDRLMPLLHNYYAEGKTWKEYGITEGQVLERNAHIAEGSVELWEYAKSIIQDSVKKGYLKPITNT